MDHMTIVKEIGLRVMYVNKNGERRHPIEAMSLGVSTLLLTNSAVNTV